MSRFKKQGSKDIPAISTASLPDIIFMLLFFFMVTTTMKDASVLVKINAPAAVEVQKLEKKSLVSYIYVGPPILAAQYGTESRIQLNDRFAAINEIQEFIAQEREARAEADRPFLTTSLKVNGETKMGITYFISKVSSNYSRFWVLDRTNMNKFEGI